MIPDVDEQPHDEDDEEPASPTEIRNVAMSPVAAAPESDAIGGEATQV